MWNSNSLSNNDLSKKVEHMSAALNLSTDCLQQFMSGSLSVEQLAAMKPVITEDKQSSSDSQTWSHLSSSSSFPSTSFGSPSFVNILSGSSQSSLLQHSVTQSSSVNSDSPFKSPPFVSDSSNLMELSTVTPSRIKNSPSTIVSKGISYKIDTPGCSSKGIFHHENNTEINPTPSSSSDANNQFKIVIGDSMQADQPITNYYINLDSFSKTDSSTQPDAEIPSLVTFSSDTEQNVEDPGNEENSANDSEGFSKRKRKEVITKLPKDLRGLMGEANLAYARGAHEDAIKMCLEVVRQAPYAAEPHDTLSMIYDEKGETYLSLQYSLLAAHLTKTDANQWLHLAGMCIGQGEMEKAIDCYSKAAKARPTDYNIHIECGKLCLKQEHLPKGILHYKAAVMLMPPEESFVAVELARSLSKMCHGEGQNILGINLLEQAFESHPSKCTEEDANLLCELYLMEKRCPQVFRLLSKHAELQIEFEEDLEEPDYSLITKLTASPDMPVDLMCKVATSAIQMGKAELVEEMVSSICSHNPSDTGDIQFELAEAYMATQRESEALAILDSLVTSRDYSLAGVWLRHAECHRILGNVESSLNSYRNCVRLAPGHVQAHLLYSKMLRLSERFSQASQTLDVAENYELEPDDHVRIYYERYKVFKTWGEKSKKKKGIVSAAVDAALILFTNKFKTSAFKEARVYLTRRTKPSSNPMAGDLRLVQIRHLHHLPDQADLTRSDLYFNSTLDVKVTKEKWLKFYDKVLELMIRCRRFKDAISLSDGLHWHSRWSEHQPTRRLFEHRELCLCLLGGQFQQAYNLLSTWIRNDMENHVQWNIFNQLITLTEDQRHQKFCLRLLSKNPANLPLVVVAAHNWMASGFYKTALGEYMYAHRKVPSEPLYPLLMSVAFINLCSQKFTDFKHSFIAQALAYFNTYLEIRGLDQESYYNIGRGMHQLGLEHFAIHYYEKALKSPAPVVAYPNHENVFCLRREIAFNLSLIYRKSDSSTVSSIDREVFDHS